MAETIADVLLRVSAEANLLLDELEAERARAAALTEELARLRDAAEHEGGEAVLALMKRPPRVLPILAAALKRHEEATRRAVFDQFITAARHPDDDISPFDPPLEIPCARCGGALVYDGINTLHTFAFVVCRGECKQCYMVGIERPKERP